MATVGSNEGNRVHSIRKRKHYMEHTGTIRDLGTENDERNIQQSKTEGIMPERHPIHVAAGRKACTGSPQSGSLPPKVLPGLLDHFIDLAFILDKPLRNPSFVTVLQLDEPIAAFAAPGHPLTERHAVSIADLSGMSFILTGKDCCYRKQLESILAQAGVTPKIVLETGSIQVLKQMAVSGLGICVLPVSAVSREIRCGQLVPIRCSLPFDMQSQLILHKDKWRSEYLEAFLRCAGNLYAPGTAAESDIP